MIALVEGAERQKTPNEIALNILLAGLTIIFVLAVANTAPIRHLQRSGFKCGGVFYHGLCRLRLQCWWHYSFA